MEIAGINIIEGNSLLAEFMGGVLHKDWTDGRIYTEPCDTFEFEVHPTPTSSRLWTPSQLQYNDRWEWLMPVVERIESLYDEHHGYFGVHISSNSCSIQGTELWRAINDSNYGYVYMSDPNAVLNTKIESTWYNVVRFIQWYNSFSAEKTR